MMQWLHEYNLVWDDKKQEIMHFVVVYKILTVLSLYTYSILLASRGRVVRVR